MHAADGVDSRGALGASIPTELVVAFERGELIVVVGPGLARGAGLPDRTQLALELLAEAEASDRVVDVATLRAWIDEGRIEASLEILERRLGTHFQRVTERLFADRHYPPPPLAHALASLSDHLRAVYTTGIDRLLERAFADQWPSIATPQPDVVRRTKLIFKLCGTLEFRDTWVLTRAALEREFGERSVRRQLVTTAYRAHCLLFIAFEPSDELTERLLSLVDLGAGMEQLPSHFVVFDRCGVDQRALFERRGLHVIVSDPVDVLRALARERGVREVPARIQLPACPYPGLQSFDDSLTTVFHGRRAEISQAASRLGGPPTQHRRWLAIDGSSGVGKSSFVHAGLVPALRQGFAEGTPTCWLVATIRPGRRPLHALVQALLTVLPGKPGDPPLTLETTNITDELTALVVERMPSNTALVVIVDQFEEIVTIAQTDEREGFAGSLGALLDQQLIYLVTTIRSDFVAALAIASPALARRLNERAERYTLAPISRVGLRLAIAEPAAQLGVTFEAELVERIATDAEQHLSDSRDEDGVVRTDDAALPLVAHVLRALWDARAAEDGVISFVEYNSLGGVSGALSRSADPLLGEMDKRQLNRTKTLLLGMTSVDDGRVTRRTLMRSEALELAGGDEEGERLLNLLSGAGGSRLLVVRGNGPDAVVDLVHEALLREWDTLRGWIEANRAQLAHDEALARRAAAWVRQKRPWRSLPRGPERRELLWGRPHGREAAAQREYQRAMRRSAWIRGGSWVGFVATLGFVALSLVAHEQERRADLSEMADELEDTEKVLLEKEREEKRERSRKSIRQLYAQHRCQEALHQTLQLLPSDPALRELLTMGVRCGAIVGRLGQLEHDKKQAVTAVAVDTRGREAWIGHADGELVRWSLDTHASNGARGLPPEPIDYIRFAKGDARVALGSDRNGTTALRDIRGEEIGSSLGGTDPMFSPDGRLVANRHDAQVNVYDANTGALVWSHSMREKKTPALGFSDDGERLVFAASLRAGSELVITAASSGVIIKTISVPGLLRDLDFVGDGSVLATTADDNFTRLWDIDGSGEVAEPFRVEVPSSTRRFVVGAPDGARVSTLASNDSIALLDRDLSPVCDQIELNFEIQPQFSLDGQLLLTTDFDDGVSLREARSGQELAHVVVDGLSTLAFSPTNAIVTGSEDGTATHWGVDTRTHWRGTKAGSQIRALAFSPTNPRLLAFGGPDGMVRTWSIGSADTDRTWPLEGWVVALAFVGDDGHARALSDQGMLYEAAARTGSPLCSSRLAVMDATGDMLAVACGNDRLLLWDIVDRKLTAELVVQRTTSLAISMTSNALAVGKSTGELELMQISEDGLARAGWIGRHAGKVTSLAFDASGTRLVSGGNDKVVQFWSPSTSQEPVHVTNVGGCNIEAVAMSPTGTLFAAGDDQKGSIAIWNNTGESVDTFDAGCAAHAVTALQFSPDEQLLAAGCSDGNVRVWPIGEQAEVEFACSRLAFTSTSLPKLCTHAEE